MGESPHLGRCDGGPAFTLGAVIQMPLVWLPINGLKTVSALHATDMCSVDWSRVYVFGALTE